MTGPGKKEERMAALRRCERGAFIGAKINPNFSQII